MTQLNAVQCAQCEQTDDHPKVHVAEKGPDGELVVDAYHFDCLPHQHRKEDIAQSPHMASVYDKAIREGVRGDDLRAHIADVHAAQPARPYVTGPGASSDEPSTAATPQAPAAQGATDTEKTEA